MNVPGEKTRRVVLICALFSSSAPNSGHLPGIVLTPAHTTHHESCARTTPRAVLVGKHFVQERRILDIPARFVHAAEHDASRSASGERNSRAVAAQRLRNRGKVINGKVEACVARKEETRPQRRRRESTRSAEGAMDRARAQGSKTRRPRGAPAARIGISTNTANNCTNLPTVGVWRHGRPRPPSATGR